MIIERLSETANPVPIGAPLNLSHDLLWTDEHAWQKVVTQKTETLTGALIIDASERKAGRPITLAPPRQNMAWTTRAQLTQLRAWADVPNLTLRLTLDDGRVFVVVYRHHEPPVIDAKPVLEMPSFEDDSPWLVTLKFMEI